MNDETIWGDPSYGIINIACCLCGRQVERVTFDPLTYVAIIYCHGEAAPYRLVDIVARQDENVFLAFTPGTLVGSGMPQ